MMTWTFLLGMAAGASAMLLGIIVGYLSGWREVTGILHAQTKWMATQERINVRLFTLYAHGYDLSRHDDDAAEMEG